MISSDLKQQISEALLSFFVVVDMRLVVKPLISYEVILAEFVNRTLGVEKIAGSVDRKCNYTEVIWNG